MTINKKCADRPAPAAKNSHSVTHPSFLGRTRYHCNDNDCLLFICCSSLLKTGIIIRHIFQRSSTFLTMNGTMTAEKFGRGKAVRFTYMTSVFFLSVSAAHLLSIIIFNLIHYLPVLFIISPTCITPFHALIKL